eukprot:6491611-Amphidinium_carterae.2
MLSGLTASGQVHAPCPGLFPSPSLVPAQVTHQKQVSVRGHSLPRCAGPGSVPTATPAPNPFLHVQARPT